MMTVLLADIALWRGRHEEAVERGRDALSLFRAINDPWGEVQAAAPIARALASLGRFSEYLQLLAELDAAAHRVADPSFARIGPTVAGAVAVQIGDAQRALENLVVDVEDSMKSTNAGNIDRALAYSAALLQNGRIDDALSWLEPAYAMVEDDGPVAALGGLLTVVFAAAGRPADALQVVERLENMQGGTYSDRLWRLWGEGFARLQLGDNDAAMAAIDEAAETAASTQSQVDQAIASLARAVALAAIDDAAANAARMVSDERLAALGITGYGWERVFTTAAKAVAAPQH
jgi:tetratricopeptide (TPR) repeat protein